jgi:hypothetical protein
LPPVGDPKVLKPFGFTTLLDGGQVLTVDVSTKERAVEEFQPG